jgi:hypothetical protein
MQGNTVVTEKAGIRKAGFVDQAEADKIISLNKAFPN